MKIKNQKIAIIGLGYVGLPLAVQFSKKYCVVGFDLNLDRISELKNRIDRTNELLDDDLIHLEKIKLTADKKHIFDSNIYIVTVPTPVDKNNKPDLEPLISASTIVGRCLSINDIVIYESTVFPGCTEQICVPILEKFSGLEYNSEFFCGYSPERINPGDKDKTLTKITKVVSASNNETLKAIDGLYKSIISAGTFKAKSIPVAEAAKVIENTQRDVNIALINELALIFDRLNISTSEVLEAASTKWNFLPFKPGLVGGHCIGVDPYYLTHKALEVGYHPEIILAGRRINDNMGNFIAEKCISRLISMKINPIGAKIALLGLTFKENCPDLRNTKVINIINKLIEYQCDVIVSDEWASREDAKNYLGVDLMPIDRVRNQDGIIVAVGHDAYKNFKTSEILKMLKPNGLLVDVKSVYNEKQFDKTGLNYWRL